MNTTEAEAGNVLRWLCLVFRDSATARRRPCSDWSTGHSISTYEISYYYIIVQNNIFELLKVNLIFFFLRKRITCLENMRKFLQNQRQKIQLGLSYKHQLYCLSLWNAFNFPFTLSFGFCDVCLFGGLFSFCFAFCFSLSFPPTTMSSSWLF